MITLVVTINTGRESVEAEGPIARTTHTRCLGKVQRRHIQAAWTGMSTPGEGLACYMGLASRL
eukprot:104357-Pleurochrysis_carterae.AAC.2